MRSLDGMKVEGFDQKLKPNTKEMEHDIRRIQGTVPLDGAQLSGNHNILRNAGKARRCGNKDHVRKGGRKWKAVRVESEEISGMYYCNAIEAIPFFRNLGGRENVTMAYTYNGYIPVEVSSISPDKMRKTVRKYSFYK